MEKNETKQEEHQLPADPSRRAFILQVSAFGAGVAMAKSAVAAGTTFADRQLEAEGMVRVAITVNGKRNSLEIDPRMSLLDALRETLQLPGTKKGCDRGQCGACTVLVNGRRINSCLTLAAMCDGDEVTTIEGLGNEDQLHPLQEAFIRHDAFQCGYCTPGQICSAEGLLKEGHAKTDADIRELMSGNICRCGAYDNILSAIKEVQASHKKI